MASYFGIVQADLENRLNVATVLALFDDGNGAVNAAALAATITHGEQELISWIIAELGGGNTLPADTANDPFLKGCALEFAAGFAIERHPEFAKAQGFGKPSDFYDRATKRAERIVDGRQRATTIAETPANVGGTVTDNSNRIILDSADGTLNSGDY